MFICCGNTLVIAAVLKTKTLQTISNVYVVGLAMADLITGLVAIPLDLAWMFGARHWAGPIRTSLIMLNSSMIVISFGCSLVFMFLISIERHTAILYPFLYLKHYTIRRAIISAVIAVSVVILGQSFVLLDAEKIDTPLHVSINAMYTTYGIGFLLMFSVINVIHIRIALVALRHKKQIMAMNAHVNPVTVQKIRDEWRITKMLATTLGCFYLCWIPFLVTEMLTATFYDRRIIYIEVEGVPTWFCVIYLMSVLLLYANSLVNPFIYAGKSKDFRKAFGKGLKCHKRND